MTIKRVTLAAAVCDALNSSNWDEVRRMVLMLVDGEELTGEGANRRALYVSSLSWQDAARAGLVSSAGMRKDEHVKPQARSFADAFGPVPGEHRHAYQPIPTTHDHRSFFANCETVIDLSGRIAELENELKAVTEKSAAYRARATKAETKAAELQVQLGALAAKPVSPAYHDFLRTVRQHLDLDEGVPAARVLVYLQQLVQRHETARGFKSDLIPLLGNISYLDTLARIRDLLDDKQKLLRTESELKEANQVNVALMQHNGELGRLRDRERSENRDVIHQRDGYKARVEELEDRIAEIACIHARDTQQQSNARQALHDQFKESANTLARSHREQDILRNQLNSEKAEAAALRAFFIRKQAIIIEASELKDFLPCWYMGRAGEWKTVRTLSDCGTYIELYDGDKHRANWAKHERLQVKPL